MAIPSAELDVRPRNHRWAVLRQDPILLVTLIAISLSLIIFVVYPLLKVFWLSFFPRGSFTLETYRYIFSQWWLRGTITNTLVLGVSTATVSTIIGFMFAYALNRTDMPWKRSEERRVGKSVDHGAGRVC